MASLGPRNSLFEELVAAYPALWNSQDPHFRDKRVKEGCLLQLLNQCNCLFSDPITLEGLKKKLKLLLASKQENAVNPQGTPEQVLQQSSVPQLSTITITHMEGAVSMQTENETPTSTTHPARRIRRRINKLEELVAEYPCLWDTRDLNYTDTVLKAQCQEQLLVKYNRLSSITITMEHLKRRLKLYRSQLSKRRSREYFDTLTPVNPTISTPKPIQTPIPASTRTNRLEELVAEYPCLWNSQDPMYRNSAWKAQCQEQLLVKYNMLSSITVNMEQLKKKLQALRGRLWKRRQRAEAAEQGPSGEDSRGDSLSEMGSSDSTDPVDQTQSVQDLNQTALFNIVFHCCGVCGEIKSECSNVTDKVYIGNNKTTLAINDLAIELDLDKLATVCQICDTKLKEMYDFVKLVKSAQDKIRNVNVVDETDDMAMDYDEDEDKKLTELTVTDTELVKPVHQQFHERKCDDSGKKCSVTIDLNSRDNDGSMDDIEVKYQMFKKYIAESEDADETTVVNEDIIDVKTDMDDDEHRNETEETLTAHNIETKSQIVTNNGVSEELVTDKRNDIVNDTSDLVKTDTASIVSEVVSREPVCVMPKSDLILLVESIVSRMLNK